MKQRKKTTPVPVRLDSDLRDRLENAADRLGSNSSAVIRLSIITQLPAIEAGFIRIPIKHLKEGK
jgi:predicted transcriptional regulator